MKKLLRGILLNNAFLTLIIFTLTFNYTVLYSLSTNSQYPSSLMYYLLMNGVSTNIFAQDSFQYGCYVSFNLIEEKVIIRDCSGVSGLGRIDPLSIAKVAVDTVLKRGFFKQYVTGEKSYWSIGSLILEVWVVRTNETVEYRDVKTGLLIAMESTIRVDFRGIRYEIKIYAQLNGFEPLSYQNNLSVISIPLEEIKTILVVFALVVIVSCIYVFLRWKEYRIV